MKKIFLFSIISLFGIIILSLSFVSAGATCLTLTSKTVDGYLNELDTLNDQLKTCTILVPKEANSLVGDGNILVTVAMNKGTIEQFYVAIIASKVTSFTKGKPALYSHEVILKEDTFNDILQSDDAINEVLRGVKNKDIQIRANTFFGKIKWFFAKFFLPKPKPPKPPKPGPTPSAVAPSGTPTGKPDFCDDTYLPGHREYAANKVKWDDYSSKTDKVCQSQFGRGIPSPCIYIVQLSIDGKPYHLCWYNE